MNDPRVSHRVVGFLNVAGQHSDHTTSVEKRQWYGQNELPKRMWDQQTRHCDSMQAASFLHNLKWLHELHVTIFKSGTLICWTECVREKSGRKSRAASSLWVFVMGAIVGVFRHNDINETCALGDQLNSKYGKAEQRFRDQCLRKP